MRRFELGMSLDYVSNWTVSDAVREIFQNSLDEEISNPENKWYFSYDEDAKTLKVGNKLSRLETKSLLLGCSSKRNDTRTIGQHGEGYKVATIVLLRNNCGVKVYNYNEKEIWTAKIIKSRRYDAEIGVFDVEKMGIFKSPPENNLVFEITGISKEDYESVKAKNLWLQEDLGVTHETEYGKVLCDERFRGMVFVKGLFVCKKPQLKYGYDLVPSLIRLDRDRGLIDSFDLQYSLGKLIISVKDKDFIYEARNSWDGYYLRCFTATRGIEDLADLFDRTLEEFRQKNGADAIPVTDTDEYNLYKKRGMNPVLVTETEAHFISNSPHYDSSIVDDDEGIYDKLRDWYERIVSYLPETLAIEGEQLIDEVKLL